MSKKETETNNIMLEPSEAIAILNAFDLAIKNPSTNVNEYAVPKLNIQRKMLESGIIGQK